MISPFEIDALIPPPFVMATSDETEAFIASVTRSPRLVSPTLTLSLTPTSSVLEVPIFFSNIGLLFSSAFFISATIFSLGFIDFACSYFTNEASIFSTLPSFIVKSTLPIFFKYSPV